MAAGYKTVSPATDVVHQLLDVVRQKTADESPPKGHDHLEMVQRDYYDRRGRTASVYPLESVVRPTLVRSFFRCLDLD